MTHWLSMCSDKDMSRGNAGSSNIEAKQLREALISAFPSETDLEVMLQDQMAIQLNLVAGGKTYREIVFNLLKWAKSQGRLPDLVAAAYRSNPRNAELNRIVQSLTILDISEHSELSSRTLQAISAVNLTSAAPGPIQQRWALLVGINKYIEGEFASLQFCINDVQALDNSLTQVGYTVVCLHDQLDRNSPRFPTRTNIEAELTKLCQVAGMDDLIWVHFACHGTLLNQIPFLIATDTRHITLAKTALPLTEVEDLMRGSQSRRLVLTLDACHLGVELGRDVSDPAFIRNAYELAEGFALIAASTAQQVSQEWPDVQHGIFTHYLLEGLTGKADSSHKGFVTVNDLQTYVVDHLRRWTVKQGGRIQEPTFRADGLGDMILATYR